MSSEDPGQLAGSALAGLERLVRLYDIETTPYRAVQRARFSYEYDAYAHLARTAEWASGAEEEEA